MISMEEDKPFVEELEKEVEEENCIPYQLICICIIGCVFIFLGILFGRLIKN